MQKCATAVLALLITLHSHTVTRADVQWNGLYHNNTNLDARLEAVPATLTAGVTNYFLEINYAKTNVNIYFLTDHPATDGSVACRTRFYSNVEEFEPAAWQTNLTLSAGSPFHGTPTEGTVVVEVWKTTWRPPNGFAGTVYYAPQIEQPGVDIQSLVRDIGDNGGSSEWGVNDAFWAQNAQAIGGGNPAGHDYSFEWTNALPLDFNGIYFNNPAAGLPEEEMAPGGSGDSFFQYSSDPNVPTRVYTLATKGKISSLRTRFWLEGGVGEIIRDGEWVDEIDIEASEPFHGLPTTGVMVMDVWRTDLYVPNGWPPSGESMYYATEVTVPRNGTLWLTPSHVNQTDGIALTNQWPIQPQLLSSYGPDAIGGHDWSFTPSETMTRPTSLIRDWAYHNHTDFNPGLENVPGLGVTHFLDVDYTAGTTDFYLLLDHPGIAAIPGESADIQLRLWSSETGEQYLPMVWVANTTLQAAQPFHGLPDAGTKTLDIWRASWSHPTNAMGFVTNAFDVYYAVLLRSTAGSLKFQTDYTWLLASSGGPDWGENAYPEAPQVYGSDFDLHDYTYAHRWIDGADDDSDGMPNWFEEQYFGGKTNGAADGHADGDLLTNIEEYIADTDPTVSESVFDRVLLDVILTNGTARIAVGPDTSTRRLYDVWWKTNLLDVNPWTPLGLDVPGRYDRGEIILTVPLDRPRAYLKTGVKMP